MSQGAFFTFGFFALGVGTRRAVQKPVSPSKNASSITPPSSSTWYIFYPTTVQCTNDPMGLPAEVRIYSPPHDFPHPENTMAFIVAKACFPNTGPILLDAISMYPIPGDPLSSDYEDRAPDMLYPYVYGLGTTHAKAETLADGRSKGFSVKLTERVRDLQATSSVHCVLDGHSPRWANVPPPSPNTLVSFLGVCSAIRPDRMLSVALEMLVYNPSAAPPSTPVSRTPQSTSTPTPSTKRRKFVAVHPDASPIPGPSTTTPSSTSVPGPPQASASDAPSGDVFGSDLLPMSSREDTTGAMTLVKDSDIVKDTTVHTRAAKGKRKAE